MRLAAYTIGGALLYALLRSGDDDDELGVNRMDELGNFTLERNVPIPLGDGQYAKVPVGFGIQQLGWASGVNLVKFILGNQSASETVADMTKQWAKAIAPVAPSDTNIADHPLIWGMQTFTPQPVKGLANIAMDVNAFGNALTNARFQRDDKAKALQGRKSTPEEYKQLAKAMAELGFDVYPEQLREVVRQYLPLPTLTQNLLKAYVENPAKEDRGISTVSPLIDRWVMKQDNDALKEKLYYRKIEEANEYAAKKSVGVKLSETDARKAVLAEIVNKRMAQVNGKNAAATKAEKANLHKKAEIYRRIAEKMRDKNMDYLLREMNKLD
jgi:hypothetical protein